MIRAEGSQAFGGCGGCVWLGLLGNIMHVMGMPTANCQLELGNWARNSIEMKLGQELF